MDVCKYLFESVMRFSRSRLQAVTAAGWVMDTWLRVRTAAKRRVALGDEQNSCKEKENN